MSKHNLTDMNDLMKEYMEELFERAKEMGLIDENGWVENDWTRKVKKINEDYDRVWGQGVSIPIPSKYIGERDDKI